MASPIKLTYHKRLFLILLIFTWTMMLSFIGFQYYREKQYRSEVLNTQLQVYNRQLIGTIENNLSYEEYIASHENPFDELRISVIDLS
ncbi:MAG: sensor histidine kinase, partial [Bacteroidales bacterium]|nr:sensor histidine kinase [Bacteroidales bacterium]